MRKIIIGCHNYNHQSLYSLLISYLSEIECEVTLIIYRFIYEEISIPIDKSITIKFLNPDISLFKNYEKLLEHINSNDVFILDEYYDNILPISFIKFRCKKCLYIVHNVNTWLSPPSSLNIRTFLKNRLRKLFINKFSELVVVGPNIKEYIKGKKIFVNQVFFIPFDFYETETSESNVKNEITITIPGSVNTDRRDYNIVLNAFKEHLIVTENSKIKLCLLGRVDPLNKVLFNRILTINRLYNNKIKYFTNYIKADIFNLFINKSDYLLANTYSDFICYSGCHEIYGVSKESGISFISVKYNKPLICKYDLPVLNFDNNAFLIYKSENDLVDIFNRVNLNDKNLYPYSSFYKCKDIYIKEIKKDKQLFLKMIENVS